MGKEIAREKERDGERHWEILKRRREKMGEKVNKSKTVEIRGIERGVGER